jgi:hypothetical protein
MVLEHGGVPPLVRQHSVHCPLVRLRASKPQRMGSPTRSEEGMLDGVCSDERARIKDFECEVKEFRKTNEFLMRAIVFCLRGARAPAEVLIAFVGKYRDSHGV